MEQSPGPACGQAAWYPYIHSMDTAQHAEQQAPGGQPILKQKELKDRMDLQKTELALERTLLAWVRTATNLLTFGFAVMKLMEDKARQPGRHPMLEIIRPETIGYVMIGAGFMGLLMSVVSYCKNAKLFGGTNRHIYLSPSMLVSYVILLLSFLILISPLWQWLPA